MDNSKSPGPSQDGQFLPVLDNSSGPAYGNGDNSTANGYHQANGGSNGHTVPDNGTTVTDGHAVGEQAHSTTIPQFSPMAICGMACRIPGGVQNPQDLYEFLLAGGDARKKVPESRYNISTWYSPAKKADTTVTEHAYFLEDELDVLDTSFFSMPKTEVERLDPQQRLLLETVRESLDDACEVGWKGQNIGVYCGTYGQDWYDVHNKEMQKFSAYQVITTHDFMVSERVSHELDLRGPSVTLRSACSSSMIALHEACSAIARGDCKSAIIGGTNIVMSPSHVTASSEQGVFSPDGSSKTFSAKANGYVRGEAVVAIFIKPLSDAVRDGNPIRAVISGTASNFDGKTNPLSMPNGKAQETLVRRAYEVAGITDFGKTAVFECHGTGTNIGDPIETRAVASVFGKDGVYISSIKPNIGHAEGAAGLTSLVKGVVSLENRTILPNIKFDPPNPKIPWEEGKLKVPVKPTPWPADRSERISINSFGIGGSNGHAILDSAASYDVARKTEQKDSTLDGPQLLVFSANTQYSIQELTRKYQSFLEKTRERLSDIAYTLANKREHLPIRSFMVSTQDNPGTPATASADVTKDPTLVMVFTGQGAQWPQMGRELLRTNPLFRDTIKTLDESLQSLGTAAPDWTIEKELLKPARTSRVNEAEFSQPLCTAIQIGLVEIFALAGIRPSAVVGHSSGELGAAYASGSLTAKEAIAAAFLRGSISKLQTKRGAMAAIGLSWECASKYLVDGVVVACDNSHNGVTLSGDADKVENVVAAIKEDKPGVLATTLKVEKAYHSHHMVEVGEEYLHAMENAGIDGKVPSVPFFSSVTGKLLSTKAQDQLGPQYWRDNLECPVRFKNAVCSLLRHPDMKNPVFFEIGPHPALAGPLRQILTLESSKAPHVPTLTRRQNGVENYLAAIGKLFTLQLSVDFKALMPHGSSIAGLPTYPWDHQRKFWYESRVSKEWRQGGKRYHDLLGRQVPESTEIEPVWRNLLQLGNVPWLTGHKMDQAIIFPFSGYLAMAGEAVEQIDGPQDTISFRDVSVSAPLTVSEDSNAPTELVTVFHRQPLTTTKDSDWWVFTISSHNGRSWTKHCTGKVRTQPEGLKGVQVPEVLPRHVSPETLYDAARRKGLEYGDGFQSLEDITASTTHPHAAAAKVRHLPGDEERMYLLHPVIIEAYFQLLGVAVCDGQLYKYKRFIPSGVEALSICRGHTSELMLSSSGEVVADEVLGHGTCLADSQTVLQVCGARMALAEQEEQCDADSSLPITSRDEWVPSIDFDDVSALIKPLYQLDEYAPKLDQLTTLAIALCKQLAAGAKTQTDVAHLVKYKDWLEKKDIPDFDCMDTLQLEGKVNAAADELKDTPVAPVAAAILKVAKNLEFILSSERAALMMLTSDGLLNALESCMKSYDHSEFLRHLGHTKPNLQVLEIGASTGAVTTGILKALTHSRGQPLYSKYVFADVSSGLVDAAKTTFKGSKNMEFFPLDIGKDLAEYGFEDRKFDLIIATGVLHESASLRDALANVSKLLNPGGRLLVKEQLPGLPWAKLILATLPGWWVGAGDDRCDEPYVSPERWQRELASVGLDIEGGLMLDSPKSCSGNAIFIARPRQDNVRAKNITVIGGDKNHPLVKELELREYQITRSNIDEKPTPGQDLVVLLDTETPFFEHMDGTKLKKLQEFVASLDRSGVFWVTKPSQVNVQDPRYGPVIGFARTMNCELAKEFATCESDDWDSVRGVNAIADVFARFQQRQMDGVLGPDFEYAIVAGKTLVHRIFPFQLHDDLQVSSSSNEAVLSIGKVGSLDSLAWSPQEVTGPQADEIEVEIRAVGLSFKDLMVAMGVLKVPEALFGYEASGTVRRVGSKVTKFKTGDLVIHLGFKAFSTTVTASELLFAALPADLSLFDGATMPLVYATAIYSLIDLGRLSKGQSVLIHGAAGGLGQAAIQLAKMLLAEVHVTVSSDEKAQFLIDHYGLPRNRIYNSRSDSFVEDLMRETGGKGVDLALNSTSGELLHATWSCIAKWGTMVELGKTDSMGSGKLDMSAFLDNRSYCCVDMEQMSREKPEIVDRLLGRMIEFFYHGHIKPIRVDKVFAASEIQDAFRYMAKGKYIGKIAVEVRNDEGSLQIGHEQPHKTSIARFDPSASYILLGARGIGRSISIWMVQHGARNLTFLSRSAGCHEEDQTLKAELESMGCNVQFASGSATKHADVERVIDGCPRPVKGIVNLQGLLIDGAFMGMNIDQWTIVNEVKVKASWVVHEVTQAKNLDLDFFIIFSSLSGVNGQQGQANYAAANTFIDAFNQYRQNLGLPCTCLTLGAMEGIGYFVGKEDLLKKITGAGWRRNSEGELLDVFNAGVMLQALSARNKGESDSIGFVDHNRVMLGIAPTVPLSSPDAYTQQRQDARMAVWHNTGKAGGISGGSTDLLRPFLASAKKNPDVLKSSEAVALLATEIGRKLFSLVLKSEDDAIDIGMNTVEAGLDSMVAVEVRAWWKLNLGFEIATKDLLTTGTLQALGKLAAEGLLALYA